jgi:hypothetical protein
MTEEEVYEEAKKRVKAKRDFYGNLGSYVVVNSILVIIWAFPAGRGYPWFLWPLGIWGAFVILDFLKVFIFPKKSDRTAVEQEAEKIKREQR